MTVKRALLRVSNVANECDDAGTANSPELVDLTGIFVFLKGSVMNARMFSSLNHFDSNRPCQWHSQAKTMAGSSVETSLC